MAEKNNGVARLLGQQSKVYYENLFSPKHIGRVSDLLAQILRDKQLDELRLRSLILFSVFEAYRTHAGASGQETKTAEALPAPLVLECGVNAEKVALGVTFKVGPELVADGLETRVRNATPQGDFEGLLCRIAENCDALVIRLKPSVQAEVICLLKLAAGSGNRTAEIEFEFLETSQNVQAAHEVAEDEAEYIELGDTNYQELLAEETHKKRKEAPSGEFIARGLNAKTDDSFKIKGEIGGNGDSVRIKAVTDKTDSETTRITGSLDHSGDDRSLVIKGGDEPKESIPQSDPRIAAYAQKVQELEKKIQDMEREHKQALQAQMLEAAEERKKILELSTKALPAPAAPALSANEAEEADEVEIQPRAEVEQKPEAQEKIRISGDGSEAETVVIVKEIENVIPARILAKARKDIEDLKDEIPSEKVKNWMDDLMAKFVAEKAKLQEGAKKLTASLAQKDVEFRNKQMKLKEEIRQKEDMLREQGVTITRIKGQLDRAMESMQKLKADEAENKKKSLAQISPADIKAERELASLRMRTERLMRETEDLKISNKQLTDQLKETKEKLAQAEGAGKGSIFVALKEHLELKEKHDHLARQADELSKVNYQLNTRLRVLTGKSNDKKTTAEAQENARKLESAMKQIVTHQRENEQLKQRVDELQREEQRLRLELKKAQNDLKLARGKSDDGGGKAA